MNNQLSPMPQSMPQPTQPNMPQTMQQSMQQQNTTVVVVNQPTAGQSNGKLLISPVGTREWSSGLCSCFDDVGVCLCVLCCTCCVEKDIAEALRECACVTCYVPGGTINLRTKTRTIGGIRGSICNDCMVIACCYQCALCQMKRELNIMGL